MLERKASEVYVCVRYLQSTVREDRRAETETYIQTHRLTERLTDRYRKTVTSWSEGRVERKASEL